VAAGAECYLSDHAWIGVVSNGEDENGWLSRWGLLEKKSGGEHSTKLDFERLCRGLYRSTRLEMVSLLVLDGFVDQVGAQGVLGEERYWSREGVQKVPEMVEHEQDSSLDHSA
jgi:hypothetical protein